VPDQRETQSVGTRPLTLRKTFRNGEPAKSETPLVLTNLRPQGLEFVRSNRDPHAPNPPAPNFALMCGPGGVRNFGRLASGHTHRCVNGGSVSSRSYWPALKTGEGLIHREAAIKEQQAPPKPTETLCVGAIRSSLATISFCWPSRTESSSYNWSSVRIPIKDGDKYQHDEHTGHDHPKPPASR